MKVLGVLRELKAKERAAKFEGAPCRMIGCRFTDADVIDFVAFFKTRAVVESKAEEIAGGSC